MKKSNQQPAGSDIAIGDGPERTAHQPQSGSHRVGSRRTGRRPATTRALVLRPRRALSLLLLCLSVPATARGTVYYVSSSSGNNGNTGTSSGQALRTLSAAGALALQPGDEIRLRCGDIWRGERLVLTRSGSVSQPIVVTSDPPSCIDQPIISGAQPVDDWAPHAANIYVADLDAGTNAGRFPHGMTQLHDADGRLPIGRWPNPDANDGYAFIDSHTAGSSQLNDAALPVADWSGARVHYRSERWLLHSREVVSSQPGQLTLGFRAQCRTNCTGWGYFLNHHLQTLDSEGEWFHDTDANRLYLWTAGGAPAPGELLATAPTGTELDQQAGVILGNGDQGGAPVHHVVVENLHIRRWSGAGIRTASQILGAENSHLTIRENLIEEIENTGIALLSYVYEPGGGAANDPGFRGGDDLLVENNRIVGANVFGIELQSTNSVFRGNVIEDIGRLDQLTATGLGCPLDSTICGILGSAIRVSSKRAPDGSGDVVSGYSNLIAENRIRRVGMVGIDVFGPFNTVTNNVIDEACSTLGEGAGIRTFGGPDFATTLAHDISIDGNIVTNTIGNSNGCRSDFSEDWGHGIYVDKFSDDVTVTGNTAAWNAAYGIQVAESRASITGNTFHDNSRGPKGGAHNRIIIANARATIQDNLFFGREASQLPLLSIDSATNVTAADQNLYFKPRHPGIIQVLDVQSNSLDLDAWQAHSGMDLSSTTSFFTLDPGEPDRDVLLINDTASAQTIDLGNASYLDVDQNPVTGSVLLPPYSSRLLFQDGFLLVDGFESGNFQAWTSVQP